MRPALAISFAVSLAACFSPEFTDGTIACGEAGCPAGMSCADDGYCYADPGAGPEMRVVLAVANRDGNNRLYAYCDDELAPVWTDGEVGTGYAVAWGDVSGDGDDVPELAVAAGDGGVLVYRLGDGPYQIAHEPMTGARDLEWGIFDDRNPAIAVASPEGFRVLAAREDWLEEVWRSAPHDGLALDTADIDGDGDDDLGAGTRGESIGVYKAIDDYLEGMWWGYTGDVEALAWGDQDDDGDPDLAIAAAGDRVRVLSNRGDVFEEVWASQTPVDATAVAWADHDGDGDVDLVVGTEEWSPLVLYRNDGNTLREVWSSDETDLVWGLDWGDLDSDGDLDLAVAAEGAPTRVYRNDGGDLELAWSASEIAATSDVAWGIWSGGPDPCRWR